MTEQREKLLDSDHHQRAADDNSSRLNPELVSMMGQQKTSERMDSIGIVLSDQPRVQHRLLFPLSRLTDEDQKRSEALDQEERQIFGDTELCVDGNGLCPSEEEPKEKVLSIRERLHHILESPTWHLIIMAIVIIDAICTSMEIALALGLEEYSRGSKALIASEIFDRTSGVIAHIFVLETLLHLWTGGLSIFTGKMEICDFAVVWITFLLRQFITHEHASVDHADLAQFILLVRLWRIVSVVDAVALAASRRAKEKFKHERMELEHIIRFWQDRYLQEKEKKLIAIKLGLHNRADHLKAS